MPYLVVNPEDRQLGSYEALYLTLFLPGLFQAISGKGPWLKLGKNDRLYIIIGRNLNVIEHNKGSKSSKIYPQNQVILNCIIPNNNITT